MQQTCIAVVDASRARIFIYRREARPGPPLDVLDEVAGLVNPARRRRTSELFGDSGTMNHVGGRGYGMDDHRNAHVDRLDTDFARRAVAEIEKASRTTGVTRIVIIASPHMLGEIRLASEALRRDFAVDELARDLVKLSRSRLRDQLAAYGFIPEKPSRALNA